MEHNKDVGNRCSAGGASGRRARRRYDGNLANWRGEVRRIEQSRRILRCQKYRRCYDTVESTKTLEIV